MQRQIRQQVFVIAFFIAWHSGMPAAHPDEFHVYYLGGQSNMDGYGSTSELPEELKSEFADIWIFHGNTNVDGAPADGRGKWKKLGPGHGVGFASDGKANDLSDRFGVELTFAKTMVAAKPKRRIAIIKYSRGGTSIHKDAAGRFGSWEPDFSGGSGDGAGINQYDHFLATVKNAFRSRDIDGDGTEDKLIPAGIVWMQGESDGSYTSEIAESYEANLKRLMDLIRAALRADDLPVVIGRISDSGQDPDGKVWDHGEAIRRAQAAFVKGDGFAELVTSTDNYGYSDMWHYDSAGYLDLGQKFAEAMLKLEQ